MKQKMETIDCKCKLKNDYVIVCEIPKAADFLRLNSVTFDRSNVQLIQIFCSSNLIWESSSFEETSEIEIPICEPILCCCELKIEFHLKTPLTKDTPILVNFALRFDQEEREKRYSRK